MKNKILFILLTLIGLGCSNKVVTTHKVNGIKMEKLNLKAIDKHINEKYPEQHSFEGKNNNDKVEAIVLTDHDPSFTANTYVSRVNGVYVSLSRHALYKDNEQVSEFYPNGNLKYREKLSMQRSVDSKNNNGINIAPIKLGESQYFDQEGKLLLSVKYDSIYKYSLEDVIRFIENQPQDEYKSYTISMLYLDNIDTDYNQQVINKAAEKGVTLKFDYPFWVVNSIVGERYETIYLDGNTGALIGKAASKIAKRVN